MTVGTLAALSIADRRDRILSLGRDDLRSAVALAEGQGLDPGWVSADCPERSLAWAVAWNLAPDPAADPTHPDQRHKIVHLGGDQGLDAPFADVWERMTRPRPLRDPAEMTTCLCDLAWSVACERRADWHEPGNRRPDPDAAFRCLWERYDRPVCNVVRSRYRSAPDLDTDSCVNEGWARVNATYWQSTARRRFLGLCPIKNFVITVSTYCVEHERRRAAARRPAEPGGAGAADGQNRGARVDALLHSPEHRATIMRCLASLPARQALYAYCRLLLGLQQNAIAAVWGTSEPAVSQRLAEAWPVLQQCPQMSDALSLVEATAWETRVDIPNPPKAG